MYLQYGNYTHQIGEAAVSFLILPRLNEFGEVYLHTHRWTIQGLLLGSSATALDTAWNALKDAYSTGGKTITLFHDDGTASCRRLRSQDCIGGTRIIDGPSSQFEPGTHTTFLPYQITVEGDVEVQDLILLSFREELTIEGGGPSFVHLEPLVGPPVKQQVKTNTTYRVIQEGEAVGFKKYPNAPPPVLGAANLMRAPRIKLSSPRRSSSSGNPEYTEFPITWQYTFESAVPIPALPNKW